MDRSAETSSWSVPTDEARFVEGYAGALFSALEVAAAAIADGSITRVNWTKTHKVSNQTAATVGQREQKYLVTYEDTVTLAKYSFELPCRDATINPAQFTDEYDITVAPFLAFCSALEAYAVSPDGNAINVKSIRLMGKNT